MRTPGVFFVHVMKTGGTALVRQLTQAFANERLYPTPSAPFVEKSDVDALLELDPDRQSKIDLFSVHMPAWVGPEVAPDHVQLAVLREPVARTVSHLRQVATYEATPDNLAEIYSIPEWRNRLKNFQTRIFAADAETHAEENEWIEDLTQSGTNPDTAATAFLSSLATGVRRPTSMKEADLRQAVRRLHRFDVVGITKRLDRVGRRLNREHGLDLGPTGRANESARDLAADDSLLEQIRDDNQLDMELYRAACRIADEQES